MRAKFINEDIDNILKSKSETEIQNVIDNLTLKYRDKVSPQTVEMYIKFVLKGYDTNEDFSFDGFEVTNKNLFTSQFTFNKETNSFYSTVYCSTSFYGFTDEIELGNVGSTFEELKNLVDKITLKWMKKTYPGGFE